ncbi:1-phosphatidylinositol 4,5-bisphosphate phosphodiesterase epsilon-1-like isoform X3 [Lutzomyia longipalpis]|uniref:1-phosphatidylinositol 4,5-bisphosphate phosphodiesterase epsilon-1-like isoform X3 n=1 Tax=Lutzomyia longipalpis TaxID=7200 RepID=UPI0024838093|nr:1-phosphatidylinositol 4,5-bisphosphate phosphodiesterase epsilon-1-like isoform X3 [Lutzomyia longipalpis]
MREAFPSLPFGSPSLDREHRDGKCDRTVEHDNIATSSSSASSSSSGATAAQAASSASSASTATIVSREEQNLLDSSSAICDTAEGNSKQTSVGATATNYVPSHPGELEELQHVLHFPEEVALRITDAEYQLFYQVPPVEYFKHVILELQGETAAVPPTPPPRSSIRGLQKRFDEVCSWVAHFIVSQSSQDERKAAFACLLRAALTCWNIGNFNGALEITTGLRSIKPKHFWSSSVEKGKNPVLDFLSAALESVEYERALARGLAMPECRVIPCFKAFLAELKEIMSTGFPVVPPHSSCVPPQVATDPIEIDFERVGRNSTAPMATTISISTVDIVNRGVQTGSMRSPQEQRREVSTATGGKCPQRKVFISDYNGDDHYFTKIGSTGLGNLEQIYRTQAVMDHIDLCHQHHHALCKDSAATLQDYLRLASQSPRQMAAACTYQPEIEELEEDYEVEIGNYNPVQPLFHDHGICMIPISSRHHKIDHHILQILHHGTTSVLWEPETPSERSCYVFFRLERSCSMVTWHKPAWRRLKTQQDFNMNINPEELVSPRLTQKQIPSAMDVEGQNPTLDEGFLDLTLVKEITMGSRNHEYDLELLAAGKRFGLTHVECCVSILYGNTLNDNRVLCLLCPPMLCRLWYVGLSWIVRGIKRQQRLADRSMFWLKEQYIQLYFEDGCCDEPLAADAIRMFGGRDWAISGNTTLSSSQAAEAADALRREASIKFKKKRSVVNLLTQGGTSSSGPASLEMDAATPKDQRTKPIDRRKERNESSDQLWQNVKHLRAGSITYETHLSFLDFIALFRSFSLLARKDLRDLFDQLSVARRSKSTLNPEKSRSAPELCSGVRQRKIGLLTRNSSLDLEFTEAKSAQKKIFDAIAASSILANCAGIDTSNTQVITVSTLRKYLEARQMEVKTEDEVIAIIQRHEPDPTLRAENCLSFEGFARYMMDKDNYAFVNERVIPSTSNMDRPMSNYYVASSHNTYLTGHQLKGESSVELYSQVLLTGCRCVELDCWDGDDGSPVIYHGHTFTTKIPFKSVVEAINKSAFVASPYPVILSIENHCSIQQQARMAHIFQNVFGEKLVGKFLFDVDYSEDPVLPSPSQLKHRILIKNKKLIVDIPSTISNPALRSFASRSNTGLKHQASQSGRTSSIISNVSGGSVNEEFSDDEYEDDDDFDNIDEKTLHSIFGSTDEKSSRYSLSSFSNVTPTRRIDIDDKQPKKRSSQIARELSDLVIYVQAIKFRGLNPISPHNSVRLQQPPSTASSSASLVTVGSILKSGSGGGGGGGGGGGNSGPPSSSVDSTSAGSETESQHTTSSSHRKLMHPNVNHPCYQCSSINEASTKKLCRKHPLAVIAHTQTQLMRTYPAGLRIDSSNFNPTFFWAFGIQMVALNYQTDDPPMHINTAMFEENGSCGFVCKPDVLWDPTHLMYRRFSPLEKEFDGLHSSQIVINVVSGQYVCQNNLLCSTYVEVEMIGIPVDCSKKKTKTIKKNALNPIWNDTFFYKVMFHDLAFLRFSVFDSDSNHLVSQRVIPLKCLRPGYRHVRLRSPTNQPLSMASLFVYSRVEEESLERTSDEAAEFMSGTHDDGALTHSHGEGGARVEASPFVGANIPLKRRMFFLMVYGVVTDEPYTILKITQESTTQEVIMQALQKASKSPLNVNDYILVEEVRRGWEKKDRDLPSTQRVLDMFEKPLQAQGVWRGEGRFILKRIGDDPSSRAWLTSIRSVSERRSICESGDGPSSWDDADNFLVCIYNVSPDIPYAILKVPIGSTAQDVLAQALIKARRLENPSNFVLVEELEYGGGGSSMVTNTQQRSLHDDENVYLTQANWKTIGRFILQEKSVATPSMRRHRLAIDKISRGFSISRAAVLSSNKSPIQVALSDPTTSRSRSKVDEAGHSQMGRGIFRAKGNSEKETPTCSPRPRQREVHSEGETLSDDDIKESDLMSTVSRLKKMSIRKLKAWKT